MNKHILSTLLFTFTTGFIAPTAQADDLESIRACLNAWENHPFDSRNPKFSRYSPKVRVFGLGGNVSDTTPTRKPALVLVSPNVSVMSKSTMELLNPNGWYCLRGKVNVLSSTTIKLHCRAHLASTSSGTTVLGGGNSSDLDHETTVLGGARINMVGCDEAEPKNVPATVSGKSESVRQAQKKLAALGYSPGPADGLMGDRTTSAIEQFQRDNNMPISGRLDDATQAGLDDASPKTSTAVVSSPATPVGKNSVTDLAEQLRKLDQLKHEGIISEQEYEVLKQKTIDKY